MRTAYPRLQWATSVLIACAVILSACGPFQPSALAVQSPAVETVTPSASPAPSRTPTLLPVETPAATVDPSLPRACRVEGQLTYANPRAGYCFSYPSGFSLEEGSIQGNLLPVISGPPLEVGPEPIFASLSVEIRPLPEGGDLALLVKDYLSQAQFQNLPWEIIRTPARLGGEPAEVLEDVPGRLSSRQVLAIHDAALYTLIFHPSDLPQAEAQLNELFDAVMESFTFFDPEQPAQMGGPQLASFYEFDRIISLAYEPALALWVEIGNVPAVPVSEDVLFSESHPAYVQFRFLGYRGGRDYDLPLLPFNHRVPQVMIFRTADFPSYDGENPTGFPSQLQALSDLLQNGLDPTFCDQPLLGGEEPLSLPFLPWVNAAQTFCAQPRQLEFDGGAGIRYLTYYSQDPSPVLDHQVFYTFQGLTSDGQFYVAAHFPVQSGVFPAEMPEGLPDPDPDAQATLVGQVSQLNALPEEQFDPALGMLDALVRSVRFSTP